MDYLFHFVYCVPSDQASRGNEIARFSVMVQLVQEWFATQTSTGRTFKLNNPIIETHSLSIDTQAVYEEAGPLVNLRDDYATANSIVDEDGTFADHNRHIFLCGGDVPGDYSSSYLGGSGGTWWQYANIEKDLFEQYRSLNDFEKPMRGLAHEMGHTFGFGHVTDDTIMDTSAGGINSLLADNDFTAGQKTTLSASPFLDYPLPTSLKDFTAFSGASAIIA